MTGAKPDGVTSASDILLRHAPTPEQQSATLAILQRWSLHDPDSFPAQLAVLTLLQWRAAANVPVEMERVLARFQEALAGTSANLEQQIAGRMEAFAMNQDNFERWFSSMQASVLRLEKVAADGEQRLGRLVSSFETVHRQTRRSNEEMSRFKTHVWYAAGFGGIVLFVLGIVAGRTLAIWR